MKNKLLQNKKITVLLVGLMILFFTGNSFAQTDQEYIDNIKAKLRLAENIAREKGFAQSHETKIGKLRGEEVETITTELDAGEDYFILGICDEDCSDMDMRILDSNNNVITSDEENDDTPVLQITPRQTARYKIQVKMVKCGNPPCFYGMTIFSAADSTSSDAGSSGGSSSNPEAERLIAQITKQLDVQRGKVEQEGFSRTHDYLIELLRNNETQSKYLELQAGTTYIFTGVCDEDCSNLDLKIFDSNDKLLTSDIKGDDLPAMAIKPTRSGRYRVDVIMAKCAKSPCIFGVGVFGK